MKNSKSGQSLIEILVSIAIVAIVLGSAIVGIMVSLRANLSSRVNRTGSAVMQEMMDKVRLAAEGDWHNLYSSDTKTFNKTSASYVVSDASDLILINGTEGVLENDITSGLMGYWKLDEREPAPQLALKAYDFSPNGNKGTLATAPATPTVEPILTNCKIGSCLSFDGTNDYVNIPHSANLEPQSVTVSAWVNLISQPTRHVVLVKWNGYTLEVSAAGFPVFQIWNGAQVGNTSSSALTFGTWAHIAGTFDNATKIIKTYLNGIEVATFTTVNPISYGGADLKISGCIYNCTKGLIDEARVYSRALSAQEINQLWGSRIYTRSFIAQDVLRDASGDISTTCVAPAVNCDPSTQKITGTVSWLPSITRTATEYITRARNRVDDIIDWSDPTTYSSQSGLNVSTPGEATLSGF